MTVSSIYSPPTYTANGSTAVFAYPFKILDQSHLKVTVNGVTKTLGTDYTVSGVGNIAGGNVTFIAAPANLAVVKIIRAMPYSRDTNYQTLGDLTASIMNNDFDSAVLMIQQLSAVVADHETRLQLIESSGVITDPPVTPGNGLLTPPPDFGWTPPYSVFLNNGVYSTDYLPTSFLIEGAPGVTTFYIDAQAGSDANPGTSALPKKSFYPVTNTRYTKLLLKIRGTFYREVASYIDYLHDNLCVEAWGGATAILTKETDPVSYPWVWTSEGSGTWSAPWPAGSGNIPSNAYAGTSVDSLSRLTPVASSALCLSTASSQYIDYGGGKLWVHTASGASPATGHTIYGATGSAGVFECSAQAYPQRAQYVGIQFRGGETAFRVSGDSAYSKSIEFVNCSFKHGSTFGAFHGTGNATIIMYGCTAGPSVFDGFSYSTASGGVGGNVPSVVEINCIGRNNGWQSTGANQGSTTHYTGKLVRVNGQYYNNADDQIADVGANTRSWNLGCTLGPKGAGSGKSGAQCGNDGTDVRMWFDGCILTGLDYGFGAAGGASIYYRNMPVPTVNITSTGAITTY